MYKVKNKMSDKIINEKLSDMKNIPIDIVAQILGKSKQFVRVGLQEQRLPIGSAVKTSTEWNYHVSYELLKQYVGIEMLHKYEEANQKKGYAQ